MDITTLENYLWEAACSIRGPIDAPKFKDYILPLLFYKRLSDCTATRSPGWQLSSATKAEAEEERAEVDAELDKVLSALGFAGWRNTG